MYPFLYPDRTIGRALLMRTLHTTRTIGRPVFDSPELCGEYIKVYYSVAGRLFSWLC
jgi:hypothetical protein